MTLPTLSTGEDLKNRLRTSAILGKIADPHFAGAVSMSGEPASSAAGGIAAWKIAGGILSIGVVASALGFMVLLPKTPREAALRALATMIGSALFGPFVVAAVYSKWPELFAAGVKLAGHAGLEPWYGLFVAGAPMVALGGLPCWWIIGAVLRWFDKRKDKDIAELAADARQAVKP